MKLNVNTETNNIQEINEIVQEVQSLPLATSVDINVNVEITKPHEEPRVGFDSDKIAEAWECK